MALVFVLQDIGLDHINVLAQLRRGLQFVIEQRQHGLVVVDAADVVALFGQVQQDAAGAAADIQDIARVLGGEPAVELQIVGFVGVFSVKVARDGGVKGGHVYPLAKSKLMVRILCQLTLVPQRAQSCLESTEAVPS